MARFEFDGVEQHATLDLHVASFGKSFKVDINIEYGQSGIADRTIQSINEIASLSTETRDRILEMLYVNAMSAKEAAAYGDPDAPEEQPPKGFWKRLFWRRKTYRFVELSHDDPRHPCFIPEGPGGVEKKLEWLEIRIDENHKTESRIVLVDCRPAWEEEHGVTVVLRNGVPVGLSDFLVDYKAFDRPDSVMKS